MKSKLCAGLLGIGMLILFLAVNWLENEVITEGMCLLLALPGVAVLGLTMALAGKEEEE